MDISDKSQAFFGGKMKKESGEYHKSDIISMDYCKEKDLIASGTCGK